MLPDDGLGRKLAECGEWESLLMMLMVMLHVAMLVALIVDLHFLVFFL